MPAGVSHGPGRRPWPGLAPGRTFSLGTRASPFTGASLQHRSLPRSCPPRALLSLPASLCPASLFARRAVLPPLPVGFRGPVPQEWATLPQALGS